MTRICLLLPTACIIAALCGCGGNATRTAPPTDDELIKGTWEVTSATINGQSFPIEGQEDIHIGGRYVFDGETLTKSPNPRFPGVTQGGSLHRYQIDATKTPKQIEIRLQRDGPSGPWPPEKTIYKVDKDSLVLCWSIVGEAAPKQFESKEGENIGLYEFRRVGD